MASISDIIKSKTTSDQAWKEERQAERSNLSAMREAALREVTTTPEQYQRYLTLQGDNMGCSAGNVALTMFQMGDATKIGTTDHWHEQGRRVMDSEMKQGAQVFMPPRNSKYRGYTISSYYDVSQTTGKPIKEYPPLADGDGRMELALISVMNFSPVPIVADSKLTVPAYYDDTKMELHVHPDQSETAVFAALATEVAYARFHGKGHNQDFDRATYQLDAESTGYMICRRFGVDHPMPDTSQVAALYEGYEPSDCSEALEQLRKSARTMGDGIDRSIHPKQQEQAPKRRNVR